MLFDESIFLSTNECALKSGLDMIPNDLSVLHRRQRELDGSPSEIVNESNLPLNDWRADILEEGDLFVRKQLCELVKRADAPVPRGYPPEQIQAIPHGCSLARRVSPTSWTWV